MGSFHVRRSGDSSLLIQVQFEAGSKPFNRK
jgi:hypothetical protein